ncbi:MAG: hypothetical protein RDU20_21555, partial [Desulfomonilaceae bacterium]|nr:hypothetical protein [Desulfomonilaceae bacterium]
FLASRKRTQDEGLATEAQTTPRDQFLDFLSEQEEDEETAGRPDVHGAHAGPYSDVDLWASDIPGGPVVTPEPIKPKWWGA